MRGGKKKVKTEKQIAKRRFFGYLIVPGAKLLHVPPDAEPETLAAMVAKPWTQTVCVGPALAPGNAEMITSVSSSTLEHGPPVEVQRNRTVVLA